MTEETKTRVLMELRPCLEGFAGIPQETRLLFSGLQTVEQREVHGLIVHQTRALAPLPGDVDQSQLMLEPSHRQINRMSRFITSLFPAPGEGWAQKIRVFNRRLPAWFATRSGLPMRLGEFRAKGFADFIWETFFSKTLPTEDFDHVTRARYRSLRAPWSMLNRMGLAKFWGLIPGRYATIDSRGYDIFFTQTPCPLKVPKGTQLLVRYHDAIPMFLPHRIPDMNFHRASHYAALKSNAAHAVFACTSQSSRDELVTLFPHLEDRSVVVHDVVSQGYFRDPVASDRIVDIIATRLDDVTHSGAASRNKMVKPPWLKQPKPKKKNPSDLADKERKKFRFIMMVSTLEPRKNHVRLIRAWERLRANGDADLKLVFVGSRGWDYGDILNKMRPWQERAQLFHLSQVSASELRQLYSSAEVVVCPSVSEGFDLSGIEGMLCGACVCASDIAVHREVFGKDAHYFDAYDAGHQADVIAELLGSSNAEKREAIGLSGSEFAQRYKRENILPKWEALFDRIGNGEFNTSKEKIS